MSTFAVVVAVLLSAGSNDRLQLARKLEASGQHSAAIVEYQKALENDPAQSAVWTELAETRLAAGQVLPAVGDFSRAVRLDPTGARQQKGLACAVEKSGNKQRALLEWRRLAQITQGPEQAEAEARVQQIMASLGQAPAAAPAETHAETAKAPDKVAPPPTSAPKAVQSSGSDPADVKKAVELWKGGKRDQALELLRGIIRKKPTTEAYYYAGVMRLEEKKYDMAEFNLRKAVSDKELGGSAWYWLGRSLEARRKPGDAKAAFRKSLELSPKGEFSAEARARLDEPKQAKPQTQAAAPAKPVDSKAEATPPVLPDSLRGAYTWYPPELRFPPGDGSAAGKMLDDIAKQSKQKQNDLALSTLEQLRLKQSAAPAAELASLCGALVYNAMGLPSNALAQVQSFLKEHPTNALADYAKLVEGVSFLRVGKCDSAAAVLGPLPVAPKGALWTESVRQSALAEALRGCGKHAESVSALKLAFQSESDPRQKRSIALRLSRETAKAGAPQQALGPLQDSRKGCDRSGFCLEVGITEADILWSASKFAEAGPIYEEIAKSWPQSSEAPWALYQVGNTQSRQGHRGEASATWKALAEKYPGSYWAAQARFRLEDAVWGSRYQEKK